MSKEFFNNQEDIPFFLKEKIDELRKEGSQHLRRSQIREKNPNIKSFLIEITRSDNSITARHNAMLTGDEGDEE